MSETESPAGTGPRPVWTEVRGRVLVVTVDRPTRRNAIDRATADGLDAAFNRHDEDPDLWCGVITGADGFSPAAT